MAGYNLAASVSLVTAQRLVRTLCSACKQRHSLPAQALRQAGWPEPLQGEDVGVYKPVGCSACHQGYRGRTGIFQVMPMSPALQTLVLQDANGLALTAQAQREGMRSLREAGLRKVLAGLTCLDEVLAATGAD